MKSGFALPPVTLGVNGRLRTLPAFLTRMVRVTQALRSFCWMLVEMLSLAAAASAGNALARVAG